MSADRTRPLIVHIVFRFDYGGLENGVVNLISGLVDETPRHAVIALTEATEFAERLPDGVSVYSLGKQPGKDPGAYWRLVRLLRKLKPAVVHTRNFGTLDCAFFAFLAGVPIRIHGEHGWDIFDPDGTNRKYRLLRRVFARFVSRFITVSADLERWLIDVVGLRANKVQHICNGVDSDRFRPSTTGDQSPLPAGLAADAAAIIGSVTRFSAIKDPLNLVNAFVALVENGGPESPLRLVMIGDGELLETCRQRLAEAGVADRCWLPGSRDDIPALLRSFDVFALGSRKEGISNTVLEAMSSGLPIVATDAGGNAELVDGSNGFLVPPQDSEGLATAISRYVEDSALREQHARASRQRVMDKFSIERMVSDYRSLYAGLLAEQGV